MIDPIDGTGTATRMLNVAAVLRRSPGMTEAQIVTYLNTTMMPDDPLDNVGPFTLLYVQSGVATLGALLVDTAGARTLANPTRYLQRVSGSDTAIELAPVGAVFRQGYMW